MDGNRLHHRHLRVEVAEEQEEEKVAEEGMVMAEVIEKEDMAEGVDGRDLEI